ncbi:DUF6750 family protein [Rugamonas apoptosis]|uniref:Uncharacterized protein n=1 Tax=Rugamonas apoptosis TaxID=2758570 RepID=A0A7W2FF99_9BURK|nr:DUF6750 family protein [Rugamonas apoptosis]MBA5690552.1 hypothetical protein [Rugamonas apoptosis]
MKKWNIGAGYDDVCRRIYANLQATQAQCALSPRQRRLMMISAALTGGCLAVAGPAHADTSSGLAGLFHVGTTQAASIKTDLGVVFAALGFGGAGLGGINWVKKGKEGEHSQLKAHQIYVPILAGAVLGAIGYTMIKAGETIGIDGSSHGVVPT